MNPPLPTITVTVMPLTRLGHKIRSEVIITAAAITRDEKLFIASIFQRFTVACDAGKVTRSLPLPIVGVRDQSAVL
jgi:hypothetical protein